MAEGRSRTVKELDSVALVRDLPEHGLRTGDPGAVVQLSISGMECESPAWDVDLRHELRAGEHCFVLEAETLER